MCFSNALFFSTIFFLIARLFKLEKTQSHNAAQQKEESVSNSAAYIVEVDQHLCQGHAVCVGESAKVFSVDDQGELSINVEACDSAELNKVQKAVKYCPNGALSLKMKN